MAISLKHAFTSSKPEGGDATKVRVGNWNAEHTITCATDTLLGRVSSGTGAVEEVTCTDFAQSLLDDAAASNARTTLGLGTVATVNVPIPVASGGTGQTTEAEALGEMIQALTEDTSPDLSADYISTYDTSADTGKKVLLENIAGRSVLTSDTTVYVRAAPQTCTMTSATPCVVSATAHGLSANDPIVFDWPTQRNVMTVTIASPGVFSCTKHGFGAGDAVSFKTTGALPTGIPSHLVNVTASKRQFCPRTYYVISAGLTSSAFQVALTPGGAAINTSGSQSGTHLVERARFIEVGTCTFATTVVTCTSHGLVVDQKVTFCGTGTANTNVHHYGEDWDFWYVKQVLSANTFSIATTPGGTAVDVSAGFTGTEYLFRFVPTLTGLQHGETYYVLSTGLTADTFRFSLSPGGSAINTTGTSVGTFRVQTGNDANDGSAATRASAFFTLQHAYDYACTLDFNNYSLTIQLADGVYWEDENNVLAAGDKWTGGGSLNIQGNTANKNNVRMESDTDVGDTFSVAVRSTGSLGISYLDFYNPSFCAMNCFTFDAGVSISHWTLSCFAMDDPHIYFQGDRPHRHQVSGTIDVLWGAGLTSGGFTGSVLAIGGPSVLGAIPTYRLFNDPVFQMGLIHVQYGGYYRGFGDTWSGTYTGAQGRLERDDATIFEQFFTLPGTAMITDGYDEMYIPQAGGQYRYIDSMQYDSMVLSGTVRTIATTFGALPAAATAGSGARAFITDCNTATFLATAAAGGANKVPVVSDGTNWLVG